MPNFKRIIALTLTFCLIITEGVECRVLFAVPFSLNRVMSSSTRVTVRSTSVFEEQAVPPRAAQSGTIMNASPSQPSVFRHRPRMDRRVIALDSTRLASPALAVPVSGPLGVTTEGDGAKDFNAAKAEWEATDDPEIKKMAAQQMKKAVVNTAAHRETFYWAEIVEAGKQALENLAQVEYRYVEALKASEKLGNVGPFFSSWMAKERAIRQDLWHLLSNPEFLRSELRQMESVKDVIGLSWEKFRRAHPEVLVNLEWQPIAEEADYLQKKSFAPDDFHVEGMRYLLKDDGPANRLIRESLGEEKGSLYHLTAQELATAFNALLEKEDLLELLRDDPALDDSPVDDWAQRDLLSRNRALLSAIYFPAILKSQQERSLAQLHGKVTDAVIHALVQYFGYYFEQKVADFDQVESFVEPQGETAHRQWNETHYTDPNVLVGMTVSHPAASAYNQAQQSLRRAQRLHHDDEPAVQRARKTVRRALETLAPKELLPAWTPLIEEAIDLLQSSYGRIAQLQTVEAGDKDTVILITPLHQAEETLQGLLSDLSRLSEGLAAVIEKSRRTFFRANPLVLVNGEWQDFSQVERQPYDYRQVDGEWHVFSQEGAQWRDLTAAQEEGGNFAEQKNYAAHMTSLHEQVTQAALKAVMKGFGGLLGGETSSLDEVRQRAAQAATGKLAGWNRAYSPAKDDAPPNVPVVVWTGGRTGPLPRTEVVGLTRAFAGASDDSAETRLDDLLRHPGVQDRLRQAIVAAGDAADSTPGERIVTLQAWLRTTLLRYRQQGARWSGFRRSSDSRILGQIGLLCRQETRQGVRRKTRETKREDHLRRAGESASSIQYAIGAIRKKDPTAGAQLEYLTTREAKTNLVYLQEALSERLSQPVEISSLLPYFWWMERKRPAFLESFKRISQPGYVPREGIPERVTQALARDLQSEMTRIETDLFWMTLLLDRARKTRVLSAQLNNFETVNHFLNRLELYGFPAYVLALPSMGLPKTHMKSLGERWSDWFVEHFESALNDGRVIRVPNRWTSPSHSPLLPESTSPEKQSGFSVDCLYASYLRSRNFEDMVLRPGVPYVTETHRLMFRRAVALVGERARIQAQESGLIEQTRRLQWQAWWEGVLADPEPFPVRFDSSDQAGTTFAHLHLGFGIAYSSRKDFLSLDVVAGTLFPRSDDRAVAVPFEEKVAVNGGGSSVLIKGIRVYRQTHEYQNQDPREFIKANRGNHVMEVILKENGTVYGKPAPLLLRKGAGVTADNPAPVLRREWHQRLAEWLDDPQAHVPPEDLQMDDHYRWVLYIPDPYIGCNIHALRHRLGGRGSAMTIRLHPATFHNGTELGYQMEVNGDFYRALVALRQEGGRIIAPAFLRIPFHEINVEPRKIQLDFYPQGLTDLAVRSSPEEPGHYIIEHPTTNRKWSFPSYPAVNGNGPTSLLQSLCVTARSIIEGQWLEFEGRGLKFAVHETNRLKSYIEGYMPVPKPQVFNLPVGNALCVFSNKISISNRYTGSKVWVVFSDRLGEHQNQRGFEVYEYPADHQKPGELIVTVLPAAAFPTNGALVRQYSPTYQILEGRTDPSPLQLDFLRGSLSFFIPQIYKVQRTRHTQRFFILMFNNPIYLEALPRTDEDQWVVTIPVNEGSRRGIAVWRISFNRDWTLVFDPDRDLDHSHVGIYPKDRRQPSDRLMDWRFGSEGRLRIEDHRSEPASMDPHLLKILYPKDLGIPVETTDGNDGTTPLGGPPTEPVTPPGNGRRLRAEAA